MSSRRTVIVFAVAAALALPPAVIAQQQPEKAGKGSQTQNQGSLQSADRRFVMEAARGNTAEVELGQLAADKGSSDAVKQFGKRMVDDHGKANAKLKQVAEKKGITFPTDLDSKHKQLHDRLAKLSGADFDKAYANEMVKDHKKDVADFKRQANSGKDPDVKAWAGQTLPTLEEHLKQAQDVQAQVKSAPRAAR